MNAKFDSIINDGRCLGKGEVVSSILPGSTSCAHEIRDFPVAGNPVSATRYATKREHDISKRGKSVDSVHGAVRACIPALAAWSDTQPPVIQTAAGNVLRALWMVANNPPSQGHVNELARYVRVLEDATN